jgi:hypothetical protein
MSAKWKIRSEPTKTVELLNDNAEFRVGEMKERVVIYERKGKMCVRRYKEFLAKFEPVDV